MHSNEHNDGIPVGRVLSRRQALALLGGAGIGFLAGCGGGGAGVSSTSTSTTPAATTPVASGTCVVKPELEIGPFFVDERLNRSDLRSDPATGVVHPGVLLQLAFQVSRLTNGACTALSGAMVDLWQADALGKYSDEASEGTLGQKFLRGYQLTDANGLAQFTLIYPGWYSGRTVHTHFRIRNSTTGGSYDFVSQLFYSDAISNSVHAQAPYASHGTRDTTNSSDRIYAQGGGQTLVSLTQSGAGYTGAFAVALSF